MSHNRNIFPKTGPATYSRRQVLASLVALGLLGQASPLLADTARAAQKPLVLAATYPAWLAARTVLAGVENFDCTLLVDAQLGCPHDYAMTPRDRLLLEQAEVVVLSGAGYEAFLDGQLLASLQGLVVDTGAGLPRLVAAEAAAHGHDGHGHAGHDHGTSGNNPHHFASPACFAAMVNTLAQALAKKYPDSAQIFSANAAACEQMLAGISAELAALPGENVHLVLQHDALSWFFASSSFHVDAVLQQEGAEAPSPAQLLELAARMQKTAGTWLLLGEPQMPTRVLDVLAKETQAPVLVLDPLASGPVDGQEPALELYARVMGNNVRLLREALAGK